MTTQPAPVPATEDASSLPDREAAKAWAKRQVDKAPPATPEQVAAIRRALIPPHARCEPVRRELT